MKRIKNFTFLLIAIFLIAGCAKKENFKRYNERRLLMGTYVRVEVCQAKDERGNLAFTITDMWNRLEEIGWRMNVYDKRSDVTFINRSYTNSAIVEKDTIEVLEASFKYYGLTDGAFDISVWPLMRLWKEANKNNKLPSQEEIDTILESMGPEQIMFIGDDRVKKLHPLTEIDLGGIAKGYAIDEAARILKADGFNNFQVDAGGDIYVAGTNCDGDFWRIAIRDPRDAENFVDVLELSDQSLTTSGNYLQIMTIQGEDYSHIINPTTGYPEKDVISASVVAPTAMEADALSTAISVLGKDRGTEVINVLGEDHMSLIITANEDGGLQKHPSNHYDKFRIKN